MHMLLDLLKTQGVKAGLAFLEKAELEGRSGDRGTQQISFPASNPQFPN